MDLQVVGPATATRSTTVEELLDFGTPVDDFCRELADTDAAAFGRDAPDFLARVAHVADIHPTAAALARLAKAHLDCGHRVSAVDAAQRAAKADDIRDDPAATFVGANVLAMCGEYDDAAHLLAQGSNPAVLRLTAPLAARLAARRGDLDTARKLLEGSDDAISLELAGALALSAEDFHKAIALLRAAIRKESGSPDAYINLSYAYACVGSPKKARRAAAAGFGLAPTSQTAGFNYLVATLEETGDYELARDVVRSMLEIHPQVAQLHFALAELYARDESYKKAIEVLASIRAEEWFANGPPVHIAELAAFRSVLKFRLGSKSRSETFTDIRKALERSQYQSEYIARQLGEFATNSRDVDALELALVHLEGRRGEGAGVACGLAARIAFLHGDLPEALKAVETWTRSFPADANPWSFASYLALMDVDPALSAHYASEGLKRFPTNRHLANNLALARALQRDLSGARSALPDDDRTATCATAAAIDIAAGHVEAGVRAYDRLADELQATGSDSDALHVRLWRNVIVTMLTGLDCPSVKIAYGHRDDVSVQQLEVLLARLRNRTPG